MAMSSTIRLFVGSAERVLASLDDNSAHSVVTDPPYGIEFMGNAWDCANTQLSQVFAQCLRVLLPGAYLLAFCSPRTYHRTAVQLESAGFEIRDQLMWLYGSGFPKSKYSVKPAHEPIVLAQKPKEGSFKSNIAKHGTGALNINECRIPVTSVKIPTTNGKGTKGVNTYSESKPYTYKQDSRGRYPANVIHDGSDSVLDVLGDKANYYYCAKASRQERAAGLKHGANTHPTVKPVDLMQWLCRLITPAGGIVLDPYMGSGTTGVAAIAEGMQFVGIERQTNYYSTAKERIQHAASNKQ